MAGLDIVKVKLVKDRRLGDNGKISNCKDAVSFLASEMESLDRENVYILNMNMKGEVVNASLASMGTLGSSPIHPREILKTSILSNANSFIMLHNHPSGDPTPSLADRETCKLLRAAARIMNIEMHDFIVVADRDNYYSFAEKGEMPYIEIDTAVMIMAQHKVEIAEPQNSGVLIERVIEGIPYQFELTEEEMKELYNETLGQLKDEDMELKKGSYIRTSLNDKTLCLEYDSVNKKALLFTGTQFCIASGIKYNEKEELFEWDSGSYADDISTISNMQNNSLDKMKETLSFLSDYDHRAFVKSLISLETGMENEDTLDDAYDNYMNDEAMGLVDEQFYRYVDANKDIKYAICTESKEMTSFGLVFDNREEAVEYYKYNCSSEYCCWNASGDDCRVKYYIHQVTTDEDGDVLDDLGRIEIEPEELIVEDLNKYLKYTQIEKGVSRIWKVYGKDGHRQRESFGKSTVLDCSGSYDSDIRIIEVINSDITGTNEYTVVRVTRETSQECLNEFEGQLGDGIFENSNTGEIVEITDEIITKPKEKNIDFEV